jgi:hypothetical protein
MRESEPKFKATVKMKKSWTTEYVKKPTLDQVLEALADEILNGNIDNLFQVIVERLSKNKD